MNITKFSKVLLTLALLVSARPLLLAQNLTGLVDEEYIGTLTVTVDGTKYLREGVIIGLQKRGDATVDVCTKELILTIEGEEKRIGNVLLNGVMLKPTDKALRVSIDFSKNITIADPTATADPDSGDTDPDGDGNTVSGGDQDGDEGFGNNDNDGEGGQGGDDVLWLGPSYGELTVNATGILGSDYADLSFGISIPSVGSDVSVTFKTANVPTSLSLADGGSVCSPARGYIKVCARAGASISAADCYTPAGLPASAGYRGMVIVK